MASFEYDADTVRHGGELSHRASSQQDGAGRTLHGTTVNAGHFGNVSQASGFAGAIETARGHHAKGSAASSANLTAQGERGTKTADLGDDNETATTALAPRLASSSAVSKGM